MVMAGSSNKVQIKYLEIISTLPVFADTASSCLTNFIKWMFLSKF